VAVRRGLLAVGPVAEANGIMLGQGVYVSLEPWLSGKLWRPSST